MPPSARTLAGLIRNARTAQLLLLIASAVAIILGVASVARDYPRRALQELEILKSFPSFTLLNQLAVEPNILYPPWDVNVPKGHGIVSVSTFVGHALFTTTLATRAPRAIVWETPVTVGEYFASLSAWPRYIVLEPTNLVEFLNTAPTETGCVWKSIALACNSDDLSLEQLQRLKDGTPVFRAQSDAVPSDQAASSTMIRRTCTRMTASLQCPDGTVSKSQEIKDFREILRVVEPGPILFTEVSGDPTLRWYFEHLTRRDDAGNLEALPHLSRYKHLVNTRTIDEASERLEEIVTARSETIQLLNFHLPELAFLILAPAAVFLSLLYARAFTKRIGDLPLELLLDGRDRVPWICLLPGWESELLIVACYVALPPSATLALVVRANWGSGSPGALAVNITGLAAALLLGCDTARLLARLRVKTGATSLPQSAIRLLRLRPRPDASTLIPGR